MRTSTSLGLASVLLSVTCVVGCVSQSSDEETSNVSQNVTASERRGVDSASAFSAADAKTLKNEFGVSWTGVYIGGKCSGGSGWTKALLTEMNKEAGFAFMPTYVGQENANSCGGRAPELTQSQGEADAHDTAARMADFGWDAHRSIPVSLDIEQDTYEGNPGGTIDYVRGWVDEIRALGYVPYVYGNPDSILAFAGAHLDIAGVWVASYFYTGFENVTPFDLHQIGSSFDKANRAWQYTGNLWVPSIGTHVDCNASDLPLAPAPGGTNGGGTTSSSSSSSSASSTSGSSAAPDACSKGNGFCTETLQCDDGHWIIRQDDAAKCTSIENVQEACHEGDGYCTKTLQCDGDHWVPRSSDASKCTSGPGA